jgi:alpha-beta hydrolase superfamily lysophospholipase
VQNKAVERFADWLTTLTVQKEVAHSVGGGSSRAKIVICGHRHVDSSLSGSWPIFLLSQSMGGLLAADSIKEFIHTRPDIHAPLWPNIIACLAFDTPVSAFFFDA